MTNGGAGSNGGNGDPKRAIGLWRFGVLGPLVSARLEHGDRQEHFEQAAARVHERPDGRRVRLSARTIAGWYYRYLGGGFEALLPQTRSDCGRCRSIRPEVAELVLRAKREKPRRSIRRIIRMLERAGVVAPDELGRSSVHRLLRQHGVSGRPVRGPSAERRSFITEHAGDLWVGDALHLHRPVIGPDGKPHKAYLLSQIDCATRFLGHSYFALSEGAVAQEHGLREAIAKYGRPRSYYVDNGSAYIADSLWAICGELGIWLQHAGAGDAPAKGVIERWHRSWREEVEDELGDGPLSLGDLNAVHWAWVAAEYHARPHDTTKRVPREHFIDEVAHLRPLQHGKRLDEVFLHRERRKVRNDGTVRFGGRLLEVRAELTGRWVELRFDPSDPDALPRVFADDRFFCDTVPLDRIRNASRIRRRNLGDPDPRVEPTGLDPLGLIVREHYQRTRPARPGAGQSDDET